MRGNNGFTLIVWAGPQGRRFLEAARPTSRVFGLASLITPRAR